MGSAQNDSITRQLDRRHKDKSIARISSTTTVTLQQQACTDFASPKGLTEDYRVTKKRWGKQRPKIEVSNEKARRFDVN
jgi:hypothetical protein